MSGEPEVIEAGWAELRSGRTGVIIAFSGQLTAKQTADILDQLAERFPGVTFAIVPGATAVTSFMFDDEAESS
jgi:hypothetical protein